MTIKRTDHHPCSSSSSSNVVESKTATSTASLIEESNNINIDNEQQEEEVCHSTDKCQQCTFSEMKAYEACEETGRWEKFECVLVGGSDSEGSDSKTSSRIELRSCKYTETDEEFAMVRVCTMCVCE